MTRDWLKQGYEREGGYKDNTTVSVWATSVWWCNSFKCRGRKVLEERKWIKVFVKQKQNYFVNNFMLNEKLQWYKEPLRSFILSLYIYVYAYI